jgi:hypothetical protein
MPIDTPSYRWCAPTVTSQPCLFWLVRLQSTPTMAPPAPHTRHFGASNTRSSDLKKAHILQLTSSHFQCSTEMTFLSCSIQLPIWKLHFGGKEVFLLVSTKTPQALCSAISQEKSNNIEKGNFSPRTISPVIGCIFPYVDAKCSTLETRGL